MTAAPVVEPESLGIDTQRLEELRTRVRREVDVDRRVADYIPEFATNGKGIVTVEQVMLHTSGFPRAPLGPPAWVDRDRRLDAFARWRLNWEPGTAHEYHATSAHWVLSELIERISGRDYRDFIHERVTGALGLPRVVGI